MNSLPKILITGAYGQIGRALCNHPLATYFNLIACTHDDLDITQLESIHTAIRRHKPDIIINTAAYTAVDAAEENEAIAMQINYHGAENLAIACHKTQILLFHLSTDYVFDGQQTKPYLEEDKTGPINVYGLSKLLGENAIRNKHANHLILRVSGVFSAEKNNFLKSILRLSLKHETLRIVSDQITCPTNANNIAAVIYTILKNPHTFGVYHYCDEDAISWHGFAEQIIAVGRKFFPLKVATIQPIITKDFISNAKRPLNSILACDKIKKDYNITPSQWTHSLIPTFQQLLNEINTP